MSIIDNRINRLRDWVNRLEVPYTQEVGSVDLLDSDGLSIDSSESKETKKAYTPGDQFDVVLAWNHGTPMSATMLVEFLSTHKNNNEEDIVVDSVELTKESRVYDGKVYHRFRNIEPITGYARFFVSHSHGSNRRLNSVTMIASNVEEKNRAIISESLQWGGEYEKSIELDIKGLESKELMIAIKNGINSPRNLLLKIQNKVGDEYLNQYDADGFEKVFQSPLRAGSVFGPLAGLTSFGGTRLLVQQFENPLTSEFETTTPDPVENIVIEENGHWYASTPTFDRTLYGFDDENNIKWDNNIGFAARELREDGDYIYAHNGDHYVRFNKSDGQIDYTSQTASELASGNQATMVITDDFVIITRTRNIAKFNKSTGDLISQEGGSYLPANVRQAELFNGSTIIFGSASTGSTGGRIVKVDVSDLSTSFEASGITDQDIRDLKVVNEENIFFITLLGTVFLWDGVNNQVKWQVNGGWDGPISFFGKNASLDENDNLIVRFTHSGDIVSINLDGQVVWRQYTPASETQSNACQYRNGRVIYSLGDNTNGLRVDELQSPEEDFDTIVEVRSV